MRYAFGDYQLDVAQIELRRGDERIPLEPQVFAVLRYLVEHRDRVVPKEELLDEIWGDRFVGEATLTSRVRAARQAVGDDGRRQGIIRTAHGIGYRFIAETQTAAAPPPAPPTPSTPPPAFPIARAAPDDLIGRSADVDAVVAHLDQNRLVTLTGPGGVGKTALARAVRHIVAAESGPDGVATVELVTVSMDGVVDAVADAIGVRPRRDLTLLDSVIEVLAPRSMLLVLDNCEHVITPVSQMASGLIDMCPGIAILATSREALKVRGEQVYPVEPLECFDSGQLSEPPAVQLFRVRATASDPSFHLDEAEAARVADICGHLDGIPLAIELAAARTRAIDLRELSARLDQRFRLLAGARRDGDPRHRTLADTISWSFDLLEDDERHTFCQLSVLAGPFDLAAAEAICGGSGDTVDHLLALVDRSMVVVRRGPNGTHYDLLESLRVFGHERLSPEEVAALRNRHLGHYLDVASRATSGLDSADEARWVAELNDCFDNLRAAFHHAVAAERADAALSLVCDLREYAMRTMRYELMGWVPDALDLADPQHHLYPTALALSAYGQFVRGNHDQAIEAAQRARAIEVEHGIEPSGLVERVLGNCHSLQQELDLLDEECRQQTAAAERSGVAARIAHAHYMASAAFTSNGQPQLALDAARRAAEAAELSASPTALAGAAYAAGFAIARHDPTGALEMVERADSLASSVSNRWMSSFARSQIASLSLSQGDLPRAATVIADLLDVWHRSGDWSQLWLTMNFSIVALARGAQIETAAYLTGVVGAHAMLGAAPCSPDERAEMFAATEHARSALGADRSAALESEGAHDNVGAAVQRARQALAAAVTQTDSV